MLSAWSLSREVNSVTNEVFKEAQSEKPWEGLGQACCCRASSCSPCPKRGCTGHVFNRHGCLSLDTTAHQMLGWALALEPARAGAEHGRTVSLGVPGPSSGGWPSASQAPLPVAPSLDLWDPGPRGWGPETAGS